ncbi:MAG: hypothetical protein F6K62_06430 [Sphaerospermopsis sp. SIO1G2]|nr:hypothetical protein [Sphaerospermopsis sp. SIO1G2]
MNSNINSENNQYQNQDIEKLRLVNQYLEKITEIDPSNKLRSLQRLDHLIGLNNANKDLSEPVESQKLTNLLQQAREAGLDINEDLRTEIKNAHPDDVLFAIKSLKGKIQKEPVNYPNLYFEKVLKDRQSKRFPGNFAA